MLFNVRHKHKPKNLYLSKKAFHFTTLQSVKKERKKNLTLSLIIIIYIVSHLINQPPWKSNPTNQISGNSTTKEIDGYGNGNSNGESTQGHPHVALSHTTTS